MNITKPKSDLKYEYAFRTCSKDEAKKHTLHLINLTKSHCYYVQRSNKRYGTYFDVRVDFNVRKKVPIIFAY